MNIFLRYDEALRKFQSAVEKLEKLPGRERELTSPLENMATIYSKRFEYHQAEEIYNRVLTLKTKSTKPDYFEIARTQDLIGAFKYKIGEFDEAKNRYENAFNLRKENGMSDDHPDMAMSFYQLGSIYRKKKDFEQALKYYQKAFVIRNKQTNLIELAGLLNDMGMVYQAKRPPDRPKSLEMYLAALDLRWLTLPADHQEIANSYTNIGLIYWSIGRDEDKSLLEESLRYLEKALTMRKDEDEAALRNARHLVESVRRNIAERDRDLR